MTQRFVQFGIERLECSGDAQPTSAGLTRQTATVDRDVDIHSRCFAHRLKGPRHEHAILDRRKIGLDLTTIDRDGTGSGTETHAGHSRFSATSGNHMVGRSAFLARFDGHHIPRFNSWSWLVALWTDSFECVGCLPVIPAVSGLA